MAPFLFLFAACSPGEPAADPGGSPPIDGVGSALRTLAALAVVDHARARWTGVMPRADMTEIEFVGGALRPHFAGVGSSLRRGRVALPARAADAFVLTDDGTGLAIDVVMDGARDVAAELADGIVVYRDAFESGHLLHRASALGTEDYLVMHTRPRAAVVRYTLSLNAKVAGLRLVADTLEVLDEGGAPRLRVAGPHLIDARGEVHRVRLSVAGCAHDTNPAAPWARAPTAPGASTCHLGMHWHDEAVSYPAVFDPTWTTTGFMTASRDNHRAALLETGHVLVVGGTTSAQFSEFVELYDPATGTWSVTGSTAVERTLTTMTLLPDGTVLAVGGNKGDAAGQTAERYDPATGMWATAGTLIDARNGQHSATLLLDDTVMVVGSVGDGSVEIYDPASNTWSAWWPLPRARRSHTATLLDDGTLLITGGFSGSIKPAEGYRHNPTPTPGFEWLTAWRTTGDMAKGRLSHRTAKLANGEVLVVGGFEGFAGETDRAELYDPRLNSWSVTGSMSVSRVSFGLGVLLDGRVIATAGRESSTIPYYNHSEIYDPATGTWGPQIAMHDSRVRHTTTTLLDGRVLVTGGYQNGYLTSSELIVERDGEPCAGDVICESGYCVDDVCCENACGGGVANDCQACSVAAGASEDGVCAAVADDTDCADGVCAGGVCEGSGGSGGGGSAGMGGRNQAGNGGDTGGAGGDNGGSGGENAGGSTGTGGTGGGGLELPGAGGGCSVAWPSSPPRSALVWLVLSILGVYGRRRREAA